MTKLFALIVILGASTAFAQVTPEGPAPPPGAAEPPKDMPAAGSIEELRKEYERVREGLFTSRARAAALGASVYSSKLRIHLKYDTPRFYKIKRATIRLDGANVFEDSAGAIGQNDSVRFEGFVAPGKHQVTVILEAEAKDDTSFISSSSSSFTIDVPTRKVVVIKARAEDGGDMGYAWPKKQKGSYKLLLDADVNTENLPDAAGAKEPGRARVK
jgi:hypothetical protein